MSAMERYEFFTLHKTTVHNPPHLVHIEFRVFLLPPWLSSRLDPTVRTRTMVSRETRKVMRAEFSTLMLWQSLSSMAITFL